IRKSPIWSWTLTRWFPSPFCQSQGCRIDPLVYSPISLYFALILETVLEAALSVNLVRFVVKTQLRREMRSGERGHGGFLSSTGERHVKLNEKCSNRLIEEARGGARALPCGVVRSGCSGSDDHALASAATRLIILRGGRW